MPLAFLVYYDRRTCWVSPMDGKSSGGIDAAIFTTHMMLQTDDLGLGSIWVMHRDPERMKQEFSLDKHLEPAALLLQAVRQSLPSQSRVIISLKS